MACARPCAISVWGLKEPGQIISYPGRLVLFLDISRSETGRAIYWSEGQEPRTVRPASGNQDRGLSLRGLAREEVEALGGR
jgi:hypothetical protein